MLWPLFWTGLGASAILLALLIADFVVPQVRTWPPPGRRSWQFVGTWVLFAVHLAAFFAVGPLDAGTLGLDRWVGEGVRATAGAVLTAGGLGLGLWATAVLGLRASSGLSDELVTDGPFRFSRNPAYVGDVLMYAGWVILWDSRLAGLIGALGALWFLLAPRAEEPWLEDRYGEAYRRFRRERPRFVSLPLFSAPASAQHPEGTVDRHVRDQRH